MTRLERLAFYERVLSRAAEKGQAQYTEARRELCRTDLFFLLVFLLKRKDVNRDWLYARCREVQADPDEHLDLWAREHYKSTIITFAKTIQDILINPEETIGIFSHTRQIAKGFLRPIMQELETNADLKAIFPDILWLDPRNQASKWSENEGIIVRRKGNPKEATLEAWGLVEGMPTSKHFGVRVYDDVIDQKAVRSPEAIKRVTVAIEMSQALGKVGGKARYIGTRYHFADPYRDLILRGMRHRTYPCTKEGVWPGTPVLMPVDELRKRRISMGLYTFGSQMLQDPTADKKQGFKAEWLGHYRQTGEMEGMNTYIIGDPANEKKKESDYTAIPVIGCGTDGNYYLLDAVRDRLNLKERGDALFELHRRWKPKKVGWEKYGLQADIEYFQERMQADNYRFEIIPLGGNVAKHDRIRKMVPVFENKQFFLPESLFKTDYEGRPVDLVQAFIEEEYKPFPVGLHEDLFDAIARILDEALGVVWPKPVEAPDRYAKARKSRNRGGSSWAA